MSGEELAEDRLAPGRLLVAGPGLVDPNFARTVVLLLHHDEGGSLGLVLNRPSELALSEPLPQWTGLAAPPAVIFVGGPVGSSSAVGLALGSGDFPPLEKEAGEEFFRPVVGRLGTVDLTTDPEHVADRLESLRVFAGCAGWAPGQLAGELDRGGWLVVEGHPEDAVAANPSELWKAVLRRQGGRLAILAAYPEDPSAN
ncbi:MAG TPA: YqgE/AlgH family protein [Acidimicrobiales bacterium]|jgi:putative transcriptional regulator|nr:YqgE/AlgH family protein [Acidimicrobiales bacterium]